MDEYVSIHFCGGEYVCCDGECAECAKHTFLTANETSAAYAPEVERER